MGQGSVFHFSNDAGRYGMRNPPLQRALVDLQYPLSPRLVTTEGLSELQEGLLRDFPVMRPANAPGFSISIGTPAVSATPGFDSRYQFINEGGFDVMIGASNATVSFSGRAYKERQQLARILETVVAAVGAVGRVTQCDRIGVRYINAAPATLREWRAWFKPEFTGWTESGIVDERARRVAMLITQLAMEDSDVETAATIRHGYLPDGIGADVTDLDAANKPSFLVDIDMATDKRCAFKADDISTRFRAINNDVARYLRNTFSEEGESHFGLYSLEGARPA
jgi:uncharacterized protein (TIGR04255 family)